MSSGSLELHGVRIPLVTTDPFEVLIKFYPEYSQCALAAGHEPYGFERYMAWLQDTLEHQHLDDFSAHYLEEHAAWHIRSPKPTRDV